MSPMLTWLIVVGIGLVIGFIVHAMIRFAQGLSLIVPLLAGIVGALVAAFYVPPNLPLAATSVIVERYIWAAIGSLVLSGIVEMLFAGSRRGRVVAI